jgi:hypothetical protein
MSVAFQIIECEQGSPEWHQARTGAITASMFAECRKRLKGGPNKGDFTEEAKKYAFRLAVERISGQLLAEDKFETFEMRRGRELEPEARLAHEEARGILVEQCGFALTADGRFGVSVDGLIDEDGISEYKCFIAPSSLRPILLDNDISDCIDQVQGGLWITGRKWAHFVLYCPALRKVGKNLTIFEVERDDNHIEAMETDLLAFDRLVEDYRARLEAK